MRRPFNGTVTITQEYGASEPGSRRGYHTGVDYGMAVGSDVVSPTSGTLHQNGDGRADTDGRGYFVTIVGDDGIGHCLYHLSQNSIVAAGSRVSEGQLVGKSGNTGQSTGPHLHWETRKGVDDNQSDFAPANWLFAGQPVASPTPSPAPTPVVSQYVRIFGDYRSLYKVNQDGSVGAKFYQLSPSANGGHLDYLVYGRNGDYVHIKSVDKGDGYIYVGTSGGANTLTQFYNQ